MSRKKQRKVIVFDGENWFVRALSYTHQDDVNGEMIYHCDKSLSGPHELLSDVPEVMALLPNLIERQ